MLQPSNEREESVGRPDGLVLLLRIAAAAVAVPAVILLVPDDRTLRVAAQHGLERREADRLVARLEQGLRAAASDGGAQAGRAVGRAIAIEAPEARFRCGAAAPLGDADGRDLGVLIALVADTGEQLTAQQGDLLADLAELAARHVSASVVPSGRHGPSFALAHTLEALPEAIAIFDDDDRFVFWNRHFEEMYAPPGVTLRPGVRFEDHLRACLAADHVVAARGREEDWLSERLGRFQSADGVHEHQLGSGRWVRVQDRRLPDGGRIGIRSDITEAVDRQTSCRLLFDANPVPMLIVDRATLAVHDVNEAAVAFYGFAREAFLKLTLPDLRPERVAGEIGAPIEPLADPFLADVACAHRTANGIERIVRVTARALEHAGRPAVLAAIFDVTEQQRMEDEVRRTRAFLKEVVDRIPTGVFVKDMWDGGRYVIYNRAGEAIVGRDSATIIGRSDPEVFGPDDAARFMQQDQTTLRLGSGGTMDEEVVHRPDGSERWIQTRKVALADAGQSEPRYILGVAEDITDRRASAARIAHMAHHDAVTDLPNRFLLQDRLEAALARLHGSSELLATFCIDLDGFKAVNDTWGHAIGDRLLRAVGERLREAVRLSDTVARIGGDEFVILQAPIAAAGEAAWLAGRLVSLLSKRMSIDGHGLWIGASIGIALAPQDGTQATELLAKADAALYQAKREGRSRFRFADAMLNGPVEEDLFHALDACSTRTPS